MQEFNEIKKEIQLIEKELKKLESMIMFLIREVPKIQSYCEDKDVYNGTTSTGMDDYEATIHQ